MSEIQLKSLLRVKMGAGEPVGALLGTLQAPLAIEDTAGNLLLGVPVTGGLRVPVEHQGVALGNVCGPDGIAGAVASLVEHLAAKEAERRALAGEVLHLYREIHMIDQLSEQLAALLDVAAVSQSALEQAHRLTTASSGGILVREGANGPLRYVSNFGELSALPEADSSFAASVLDRDGGVIVNAAEIAEQSGWKSDERGMPFRSLICAPLRAKQRTVGLIVLTHDGGYSYTAANLKLLNTIALQTAAAIENSMMCAEMVENARYREQLAAIQKELDTARAIQHSLVPSKFPPFPDRSDFDLHAQMTSARAVGGDFFDYFLIDNDHLGIVVGDVSGKGTPAALYMAMAHTHVRSTALRGLPPGECLSRVNAVLVSDKGSSMFATCFYGILNTRTGELRYSSAGHNPPYLVSAGGSVSTLDLRGGTPLGLVPCEDYEWGSVRLDPGDSLFAYTDGVSEAINEDYEDFGDERLANALRDSVALPAPQVIDTVTARLLTFTAGAPQSDDITMVALRLMRS